MTFGVVYGQPFSQSGCVQVVIGANDDQIDRRLVIGEVSVEFNMDAEGSLDSQCACWQKYAGSALYILH